MRKANILDRALYRVGFAQGIENVSDVFNKFSVYVTQDGDEYNEKRCKVAHKSLAKLNINSTTGSIYLWNGSCGETADQSLYICEFTDSTIEMVKPDYTSGSNYAYSETVREDGETISECINRMQKEVKRIIHIIWNYSEWNTVERERAITIYE